MILFKFYSSGEKLSWNIIIFGVCALSRWFYIAVFKTNMKHTFSPICLFARRISHKYILVNYLEKLWPDLEVNHSSLVTKSGHFNALHPDSVVQDGLFFFFLQLFLQISSNISHSHALRGLFDIIYHIWLMYCTIAIKYR